MVKLALSGLDGIESSQVNLRGAIVHYDPKRLNAGKIVDTINGKTYFKANLKADGPHDPSAALQRMDCAWYNVFC